MRTASWVEFASIGEFEARYPDQAATMLSLGEDACACIPITDPTDATRVLAVVRLGWTHARAITDDSRSMLRTVAAMAGLALHRVELTDVAARNVFRSALDAMTDTVGLGHAIRDDEGRIVDLELDYMNPVGSDGSGRVAGDLVGRRMCDVYVATPARSRRCRVARRSASSPMRRTRWDR